MKCALDLQVAVGKQDWVAERTGGEASTSGSSKEEEQGRTVVFVGIEGEGLVGHMAFSDTLREDAADVVGRLGKLGVRVILLSGDRQAAATSIASQVCYFVIASRLMILYFFKIPDDGWKPSHVAT